MSMTWNKVMFAPTMRNGEGFLGQFSIVEISNMKFVPCIM